MEFKVAPNTDIRNSLEKFLHNYTNMNDGDSEKSKFINLVIKGLKADITKVCKANRPKIELWTHSSQKRGFLNWPDVPWLAFGGPNFFSDDAMSFSLNVNFQWPANKRGVYLTILPLAIGWHQRFSHDANRVFDPYRRMFTEALVHLRDEGFSFDRNVDPGTRSETAVNMAEMYIVHKFYPLDKMPSEESIQRDIVLALDAQQHLVRPNGSALWSVTIPILDGYTEASMLDSWLEFKCLLYGDFQLKGKDLSKLWGHPTDNPATRSDLANEMRKMGVDDWKGNGIWMFIKKMREEDLVIVQNGLGESVAIGKIGSACQYIEDSRIPLFRMMEWSKRPGTDEVIDPSKAVALPRLI